MVDKFIFLLYICNHEEILYHYRTGTRLGGTHILIG